MIASCSAWMVATMSAMRPVPLGGERGHERRLALEVEGVGVQEVGVEDLVVDPDDLRGPCCVRCLRARAPSGVAAVAW